MLKLIKNIFRTCVLLLAFGSEIVYAQDPEFTQFYSAPLNLNPALAGTAPCSRAGINYRNQWSGIGSGFNAGFTTYLASYDHYAKTIRSGLGIHYLMDNAGAVSDQGALISMNYITGSYAYRIWLDETTIQFGLQGGYAMSTLSQNLIFEDQIDRLTGPTLPTSVDHNLIGSGNHNGLFFSAGAVVYNDVFYGGFAIKNGYVNSSSTMLTGIQNGGSLEGGILARRITLHGGAIIPLNKRYNQETFLAPEFIFTTQGPAKQLNFGVYWDNRMIFAGMWARHTLSNLDAFIPYAGIKYDMFKISYSFDVTLSKLQSTSSFVGTHEIAIIVNFCPKNTPRFTYCPRLT